MLSRTAADRNKSCERLKIERCKYLKWYLMGLRATGAGLAKPNPIDNDDKVDTDWKVGLKSIGMMETYMKVVS